MLTPLLIVSAESLLLEALECLEAMVDETPPPDPEEKKETPEPPTPRGDLLICLLSCKALLEKCDSKSKWSPFGAVVAGLPHRAPSRNGLPLLLMAKHGLLRAPTEKDEAPTPGGGLSTEFEACKALVVRSDTVRVLLGGVPSRTSSEGGGGVDNTLTASLLLQLADEALASQSF